MPAKFSRVYKYTAPDGWEFDTLEEEQKHELKVLLTGDRTPTDAETLLINVLVGDADKVAAILKQSPRKHASPAKPRKTRAKKAEVAA